MHEPIKTTVYDIRLLFSNYDLLFGRMDHKNMLFYKTILVEACVTSLMGNILVDGTSFAFLPKEGVPMGDINWRKVVLDSL